MPNGFNTVFSFDKEELRSVRVVVLDADVTVLTRPVLPKKNIFYRNFSSSIVDNMLV